MTRKQVEDACAWVLGIKSYNALVGAGVPLPKILDMAAATSFREDWPNEGRLDYIRGAMMMLEDEGKFTFDGE